MGSKLITMVYVYDGYLVIHTPDPDITDVDWVPRDLYNADYNLIMDSGERLGCSPDAMRALQMLMEEGRFSEESTGLGHIDWYPTDKNRYCFEWQGGPNRIMRLDKVVLQKGFRVGSCTLIPNHVPTVALLKIYDKESADGKE